MEGTDGKGRGMAVEQTVVVRDAEGNDTYRLRLADGEVSVETVGLQWTPRTVPVANMREAVAALYAMGGEG